MNKVGAKMPPTPPLAVVTAIANTLKIRIRKSIISNTYGSDFQSKNTELFNKSGPCPLNILLIES